MKKKNIKIVNRKKFTRSILILLGMIIVITTFLTRVSFSHNEREQMDYKTILVCQGDTLWEIATVQQKENEYYQDKDVRFIVNQLKKINGLNNANLNVGQELKVPTRS